jgi:putative transcriptional regulator
LIAVPQLGDPNFYRSVIIMLEHGEQGSMGLVISRATTLSVGSFCDSQGLVYQGDATETVYLGGPVQTERAFILHSPGPRGPETEEILEGVHISYSLESLRLLSQEPTKHLRIYLGYAGWGPGQLAHELSEGAWLVHRASADLIFAGPDTDPWNTALAEMGIDPVRLMHSAAVH